MRGAPFDGIYDELSILPFFTYVKIILILIQIVKIIIRIVHTM